jgi:two-component system, NarL family, response regulator NreC
MITVLLADDHVMVRDGLRYLLEAAGDIQIVAMAADGEDAVTKAIVYKPDVAIIDVSMPDLDGLAATQQIVTYCPNTRVLLLSMYHTAEYVQRALEVGAFGYVLKDEAGYDLLLAVRALYRGSRYFSKKIAEIARNHLG